MSRRWRDPVDPLLVVTAHRAPQQQARDGGAVVRAQDHQVRLVLLNQFQQARLGLRGVAAQRSNAVRRAREERKREGRG